MKMKKVLCTAMAGAMALSMAATALAAETDLTQSTEVAGTTKTPTISIAVPTSASVVLNPYKMEVVTKAAVEADPDVEGDEGTPAEKSTEQIISAVQYIKNKTDVAMNVSATVTGKIDTSSKATFATATTQGGTKAVTTKSVFMYLEVLDAGAGDDDEATEPTTPVADTSWKTYAASNANQVLVGAKATTKANLLTTKAVADGESNFIAYRLSGDLASSPTEAWTNADTVSATIAFTFQPTYVKTTT